MAHTDRMRYQNRDGGMKPFEVRVSSRYGSPMGRRNSLPEDKNTVVKLRLMRVPFVDGDYDRGGAYWGGGPDVYPLWCAWEDNPVLVNPVVFYCRARTRVSAKTLVWQQMPLARFYH